MSRTSSLIDESCFLDVTKPSSPCAVPFAGLQPLDAQSRNPNLKNAYTSSDTVHRTINGDSSGSPVGFFGSNFSGARRTGGENISPSHNSAHSAFKATGEGGSLGFEHRSQEAFNDTVFRTGQKPYLAYGDDVEDVDPSIGTHQTQRMSCTRSPHSSVTNLGNEACTYLRSNVAKTHSTRSSKDEDVLGEMFSIETCSRSRKSSPRLVVTSTAPPAFKRIVSSMRSKQCGGPQQLTPSEERQDLGDEFEPPLENNNNLEVPQQREGEGHRKTSSGFSSGFLGAVRSASPGRSSSNCNNGSQRSHRSRSRWSRIGKGSSTLSETPIRLSFDSGSGPSPGTHKATADRALQRRRIIGELISSETGYIYDLRILTHGSILTAAFYSIG